MFSKESVHPLNAFRSDTQTQGGILSQASNLTAHKMEVLLSALLPCFQVGGFTCWKAEVGQFAIGLIKLASEDWSYDVKYMTRA